MTGSGLPEPNGPARSIIATRSRLAPAALTAPSIIRPLAPRAVVTSALCAASRNARYYATPPPPTAPPARYAGPRPINQKPCGAAAPRGAGYTAPGGGGAGAGTDA